MMTMMRRWLLRTHHPAKLRKVQRTTLNEPKTTGCSRPGTSWTKRESNSLTGNCSSLPKKSVRRLPRVRDLCVSFVTFWKRWQELCAIHCWLKESQKLHAAVITQWRDCVSCVLQLSHSEETASAVCCSYHTVKRLCQLCAAVITQWRDCISCVLQLSHSEETASAVCCSYHTVRRLSAACCSYHTVREETVSAAYCSYHTVREETVSAACCSYHTVRRLSAACCSYHTQLSHNEETASAVFCSYHTVRRLHQLCAVCRRLKGLYELHAAVTPAWRDKCAHLSLCCERSVVTVPPLSLLHLCSQFHLPFRSLPPCPQCY